MDRCVKCSDVPFVSSFCVFYGGPQGSYGRNLICECGLINSGTNDGRPVRLPLTLSLHHCSNAAPFNMWFVVRLNEDETRKHVDQQLLIKQLLSD